ncbi:hypothetical protein J4437_01560 [Candidatus Woesearchaeota archaeon]|nr:hypothetical protein [Candidatus Woesearchaeota archaeon]
MVKINGFFESFLDRELYEKIQGRSKVIRIHCLIRLKKADGWTDPYPAIIDTGAHTSFLPYRVWSSAEHHIFGDHYVKGLVPEAKINVKVGEVTAIMADVLNTSKEYTFLCFLSPNDNTPIILGFKELLSNLKLEINYPKNKVILEEE